ncbi:hypothetical protein BC830DRAFT_1146219 [Chytriomyces sp. MP71]|nr:hypothetical protein BC830DRAFT_1146219 [Chytriomyces sp. MP71]
MTSVAGRSDRRDDKSTTDDIAAKLWNIVFSAMYLSSKHMSGDTNMFFHTLELLIEFFQNLSFPLLFYWAPWGSDVTWFRTFLNYVTPYSVLLQFDFVLYILIGILSIVFITSAMIGNASMTRKLRFMGPVKFLRYAKTLSAGIFYIPIVGLLTFYSIHCQQPFDPPSMLDPIECTSAVFIVRSVGCSILTLLFILMCMMVKVSCFEFEPKLKDITCRPNSRCAAVYIIVRTIMTIEVVVLFLYGAGSDGTHNTQNWIVAISFTALSGLAVFMHMWYIPDYHFKYAQVRAGIKLCFFWSCLAFLYTLIRPGSDIGVVMIFTCPAVSALAGFLLTSRRQMIERTPIKDITDPHIAELRIRFKLIEHNLLFFSADNDGAKSGRSPGDLGSGSSTTTRSALSELEQEKQAVEEKVFSEVNAMLIQLTKQMPKSCMLQIVVGTFQNVYLKNRAQALAVTAKAASMNPSIPESFLLFRRNRDLNERTVEGSVFDFIAYEKNMKSARRNERKATLSMVQFWQELMKKNPSIRKLESHGSAITAAINEAQKSYLTLIQISPNSPSVFRSYGSFVINILDNQKQGQQLLDHAEELEEEAQREMANSLDDDLYGEERSTRTSVAAPIELDMFSDENALVTISGEAQNLCQVIQVNATYLKTFGFKKHEIVGQNICKMIPNPFSAPHNTFIERYLETGFAKVIDRPRQILSLTSAGYLLSVTLCVKHVVDPNGKQSFVGILKPVKAKPSLGFVILKESFHILHASENLAKLLEINIRESTVSIIKAFPSIDEASVVEKAGLKSIWITKEGVKYNLELYGDSISLAGTTSYICRIKFKETSSTLGADLGHLSKSNTSLETDMTNPMMFSLRGSQTDLKPAISLVQNSQKILQNTVERQSPRRASSIIGCPFKASAPEIKSSRMELQALSGETASLHRRSLSRASAPPTSPGILRPMTNVFRPPTESNRKLSFSVRKADNESEPSDADSVKDTVVQNIQRTASVSSKGSKATSKHGGRNKYETQLKITVAKKNAQSNRNLGIVHSMFQVSFLIFIGMAIFSNIYLNSVYSAITNGLVSVEKHSEIVGNMLHLVDSVRVIDLYRAGGWWYSDSQFVPDLNATRAFAHAEFKTLASNRTNLLNIHGITVNFSSPVKNRYRVVDSLQALYTTQTVADYTITVPFNDRLLMQRISFVLENAPNTCLMLLNTSTNLAMNDYNEVVNVQPNRITILSIVGPVTGFFLVLLLFPIHYRINYMRREFLGIFCDIPKEIVKGIYHARLKKVLDNADRSDSEDEEEVNLLRKSQASINDVSIQQQSPIGNLPLSIAFKQFMIDKYQLGIRSLFIFFLSLGYFIGSNVVVYSFVIRNKTAANSLYWSAQRLAYMKETTYWIREAFISLVAHSTNTTTMPSPASNVSIMNLLDSLAWIEEGVVYGDSVMNAEAIIGFTSTDPIFQLSFQNACTSQSPSDCPTYHNSLFSRGLHAVVARYISQATSTLQAVQTANVTDPNALVKLEKLVDNLRTLDIKYLTPALKEAMDYYTQPPQDSKAWFYSFHLSMTVVFISLLILFYLVVIRKLVKSIRSELRQTRGLVYMLPADVLLTIPSFKKWSEEGTKKLKGEAASKKKVTSFAKMAAQTEKPESPKLPSMGKPALARVPSVPRNPQNANDTVKVNINL